MSTIKKALERLENRPKDFTWSELQRVMTHFGYMELVGGGSRRKFINVRSRVSVSLHEPHPKSEVKGYALDIVIRHLREEGLL